MTKNSRIKETFLILVLVLGAIRGLYELRHIPVLAPYVAVMVAALLIYVPVIHAAWRKEKITYLDRSWKQWKFSLKWFGIWFLLVMPSFLIGNHYWQQWVFGGVFMPKMLPNMGGIFVDQLFLVAIPEEMFFRGWFQPRLDTLSKKRWNIFGVQLGWTWILGAAIFATAHTLIHFQWWHFAIFFPSLLFIWLKEKTGTITAPALFHCVANLAMYWIGMCYV